jgi:hypothetical protein
MPSTVKAKRSGFLERTLDLVKNENQQKSSNWLENGDFSFVNNFIHTLFFLTNCLEFIANFPETLWA